MFTKALPKIHKNAEGSSWLPSASRENNTSYVVCGHIQCKLGGTKPMQRQTLQAQQTSDSSSGAFSAARSHPCALGCIAQRASTPEAVMLKQPPMSIADSFLPYLTMWSSATSVSFRQFRRDRRSTRGHRLSSASIDASRM